MEFQKLDFENPKPLYQQFCDIIVQKIEDEEIAIGQKIPSQNELCKIFNISVYTVKEGLSSLVKEGYISRRPNRGTFVINSRPLKKKEIGVVVFPRDNYIKSFEQLQIFQSYSYPIVAGIEEQLKEDGLFNPYEVIYRGSKSLLEQKIKDLTGLIITGRMPEGTLKTIKELGLPFVMIGDVMDVSVIDIGADIITDDAFRSVYLSTKHLTSLGHKRILYIGSEMGKYSWTIQHFEGYKKALEESSISCDSSLIIDVNNFDTFNAYFAIKDFLKKSIPFTAFIGMSDEICTGAIGVLKENNIRIPVDISAVCNDYSPRLTMINYNLKKQGKLAVKRLAERLNNPDVKPMRILVPPGLIIKNSCRKINNEKV